MYILKDYLRRNKSRILDTSEVFQTSEAASPPGGFGGLAPRGARRLDDLHLDLGTILSLKKLILDLSWLILGLSWLILSLKKLILGISFLILAASWRNLEPKSETIKKTLKNLWFFMIFEGRWAVNPQAAGPSWDDLDPVLAHLGPILARLEPLLAHLGPLLAHFGTSLC